MQLDFDTRLTLAFILGVAGLIWQGILVTAGGEASEALITAFSTIILATIGIGIKSDGSSNDSSDHKE
jgi:hypothetical protein